jgi:hypothetical protein
MVFAVQIGDTHGNVGFIDASSYCVGLTGDDRPPRVLFLLSPSNTHNPNGNLFFLTSATSKHNPIKPGSQKGECLSAGAQHCRFDKHAREKKGEAKLEAGNYQCVDWWKRHRREQQERWMSLAPPVGF